MVRERPQLAVVALPFPKSSGGGVRALKSLELYARYFNVKVIIPHYGVGFFDRDTPVLVRRSIGGYSILRLGLDYRVKLPKSKVLSVLPLIPGSLEMRIDSALGSPDAIVVLHETPDAMATGYVLAKKLDAPSMILLQNPVFIRNRERRRKLLEAIRLYRQLAYTGVERVPGLLDLQLGRMLDKVQEVIVAKYLRGYTIAAAVSRSISLEMEWPDLYVFDPGVSLNNRDRILIERVKRSMVGRRDYIVFAARPTMEKGIADALLALKLVASKLPGVRLLITGFVKSRAARRISVIARRLGVRDHIEITGYLPREQYLAIVASAKLVLHPTHMDSFSFTVYEALSLGTPVVAYNVPALRIYYGRCPGIWLVEENSYDELADTVVNVFSEVSRGVVEVRAPRIPSWDEIAAREYSLVRYLVELRHGSSHD